MTPQLAADAAVSGDGGMHFTTVGTATGAGLPVATSGYADAVIGAASPAGDADLAHLHAARSCAWVLKSPSRQPTRSCLDGSMPRALSPPIHAATWKACVGLVGVRAARTRRRRSWLQVAGQGCSSRPS